MKECGCTPPNEREFIQNQKIAILQLLVRSRYKKNTNYDIGILLYAPQKTRPSKWTDRENQATRHDDGDSSEVV